MVLNVAYVQKYYVHNIGIPFFADESDVSDCSTWGMTTCMYIVDVFIIMWGIDKGFNSSSWGLHLPIYPAWGFPMCMISHGEKCLPLESWPEAVEAARFLAMGNPNHK
jgi:hypothetical protein